MSRSIQADELTIVVGASLRLLYNYTRNYALMYPNATQLLVRCDMSFFWSSAEATASAVTSPQLWPKDWLTGFVSQESRLAPLVEVLASLGCIPQILLPNANSTGLRLEPQKTPKILCHSMSNGTFLRIIKSSIFLTVFFSNGRWLSPDGHFTKGAAATHASFIRISRKNSKHCERDSAWFFTWKGKSSSKNQRISGSCQKSVQKDHSGNYNLPYLVCCSNSPVSLRHEDIPGHCPGITATS